jgi:hypothetical protein
MEACHREGRDEDSAALLVIDANWTEWNLENISLSVAVFALFLILRLLVR